MISERASVHISVMGRHTMFREGLVSLLRAAGFSAQVDERREGSPDVTRRQQPPDVRILLAEDVGDTGMLFECLAQSGPGKTLVLYGPDDTAVQARAIELGARGVLDMNQGRDVLLKAVDRIHAGEMWLDRAQMVHVVASLTRRRTERTPEQLRIESLTTREREIVGLVAEGLTNADIAERLGISEATARNHLTSILDKLEFKNRFQLAVYALRRGLVECPAASPMMRLSQADSTVSASVRGRTGRRRTS
jgi:DNA-binding NarL/FixJ family response regulator